jgi:hypothetical protein
MTSILFASYLDDNKKHHQQIKLTHVRSLGVLTPDIEHFLHYLEASVDNLKRIGMICSK